MKVRTALLLITLFSTTLVTNALAGDRVRNGAGLAESNFAFARVNLADYLIYCLQSKFCLSSERDIELAKRILDAQPEELRNSLQLKFKPRDDIPDFFLLDGQERIAKTGDNIGDNIYINLDLIYQVKDGELEVMDIAQAAAILFHEYGHHVGTADHDLLDAIGAKIGFFISRKSTRLATHWLFGSGYIQRKEGITLSTLETRDHWELLLARDDRENYNITAMARRAIEADIAAYCQANFATAPDGLCGDGNDYSLKLLYFIESYWGNTERLPTGGGYRRTITVKAYSKLDTSSKQVHCFIHEVTFAFDIAGDVLHLAGIRFIDQKRNYPMAAGDTR